MYITCIHACRSQVYWKIGGTSRKTLMAILEHLVSHTLRV